MNKFQTRIKDFNKPNTSAEKVYYFAFGSNMNHERMSVRGVSFFRRFGAKLRGYRLDFNKVATFDSGSKEGYANIVQSQKSTVEGIIYETTVSGIAMLDKFEGVPSHYYKTWVQVETEKGESVKALVYVAQPNMTRSGLKPGRAYLGHLLAGKEFLSPQYYKKLAKWETAPVKLQPTTYTQGSFGGGVGGSIKKLVSPASKSALHKYYDSISITDTWYRDLDNRADEYSEIDYETGVEEELEEEDLWSRLSGEESVQGKTSQNYSEHISSRRSRASAQSEVSKLPKSSKDKVFEVLDNLELDQDVRAWLLEEAANYKMSVVEFLHYIIERRMEQECSYDRWGR